MDEKSLRVRIKALDEKFTSLLSEAEKRNGQRFDAQQMAVKTAMEAAEKAVNAAMAAAEKAVTKAEVAADKRFDGLNELRGMAADWRQEFARASTVDLQFKAVNDKQDSQRERLAALAKVVGESAERGMGRNDIWTYLVAGLGLLATITTVVVLLLRR